MTLSEQQLQEIEERAVQVTLSTTLLIAQRDPDRDVYVWTHPETRMLSEHDARALIAEVRRLRSALGENAP
jgi:hypothetical protein